MFRFVQKLARSRTDSPDGGRSGSHTGSPAITESSEQSKSPAGIVERRAHERFKADLDTWVKTLAVDDLAPIPAVIQDISGGGMSLRVGWHMEPGEHLSLTFKLPQERIQNEATVEVLSCEPGDGFFVARCRFLNLPMGRDLLNWTLTKNAEDRSRAAT
jgi:hypothetical protein